MTQDVQTVNDLPRSAPATSWTQRTVPNLVGLREWGGGERPESEALGSTENFHNRDAHSLEQVQWNLWARGSATPQDVAFSYRANESRAVSSPSTRLEHRREFATLCRQ